MGPAVTTAANVQQRFAQIRGLSDWICAPVSGEDATAQSMPDASPLKWHLAHTTWFFETFVLEPHVPDYRPFSPAYRVLFNSYYNGVGEQHARPERGLITRPGLEDVQNYRRHVDGALIDWLETQGELPQSIESLVTLGLNHEQQHQELMLMDLKHLLSRNPLDPVYRERDDEDAQATDLAWISHAGGVQEIGYEGSGFHFDNESPRHKQYLRPFEIASRPVSNGEYLRFIEEGGYRDPLIWLADGWSLAQRENWNAPLYWRPRGGGGWEQFTLAGIKPIDDNEPVCHVSFYEAAAFAQWSDARLPTEAEWEVSAAEGSGGVGSKLEGRFLGEGRLHPGAPLKGDSQQWSGDVWEWTASAYQAYPGFKPLPGALGEYNGKFMCNQQVLRGGCCVTPDGHTRLSYRNFFYPYMRWQFAGIRLARDA